MKAAEHKAIIKFIDRKNKNDSIQESIIPYYSSDIVPKESVTARFYFLYSDPTRSRFIITNIERFN